MLSDELRANQIMLVRGTPELVHQIALRHGLDAAAEPIVLSDHEVMVVDDPRDVRGQDRRQRPPLRVLRCMQQLAPPVTALLSSATMSDHPVARPQPGIFALGSRAHHHLEFDLPDASTSGVLAALGTLREPHVTGGAANLVLGFGASLWTRICTRQELPADLGDFTEIVGRDGHRAPATQHDLWAWVHGSGADEVLDTSRAVTAALSPLGQLAVDQPCFVYHDSRDLTGFIDGSANPAPAEAPDVACIPHGRPGAGGSHVLGQRWVHSLDSFAELDVADQERVFGRTKLDSVALPRDIRPADSHITMAEIHDADGEERPIYRRSTAFGDATEQGLYFVAFSAERDRFDEMLAQMYGTGGRELRDCLLDFSTAMTGSYYFAPSADALLALGVTGN